MFCRLQTHGMVECREKEVCGVLCSQERALQRVCRFPITMQVVRADLVDLDWFWQLIRSVLDWMFKNLRNREVSPVRELQKDCYGDHHEPQCYTSGHKEPESQVEACGPEIYVYRSWCWTENIPAD